MAKRSILLVSCKDRNGLVHEITGALHRRGANVIEIHEAVDFEKQLFFMRTEFTGDLVADSLRNEVVGLLPEGAEVRLHEQKRKRVVLLCTRESHCLGDLLLRYTEKELPGAEITGVVSQYPDLQRLTDRFGLPFTCVPVKEGAPREEHEERLLAAIEPQKPDLLVLAKYMRVLGPQVVSRYVDRILNIHHSFLPAFVGSKPYQQAYERGVKIIGATAHIVNADLDDGPIIAQAVMPVTHVHTAADMARMGREVEKSVLARAFRFLLEDRVIVNGRRTLVFE